MPIIREIKPVRTFIGKLAHGSDLLNDLTEFCTDNNITIGRIEGIGAVKKARLAYYNQDKKKYEFFEIKKHLEICSLVGNVSIKGKKPIVHAHVTFADKKGKAYGGHLAQGTIVFACEVCIQVFQGETLFRDFDEITGLPLWDMTV